MKERDAVPAASSERPSGRFGRPPLAPLSQRRIVFISHANPEDNPITAWYGARLTAAGYEVWTDLTRLLGGEEMWLDIDDALRYHARKVIVLLSQATTNPRKEGIRAEIDRATALRRKLGDRRFVIPIRIDRTPHEDFPPGIGNRTVIDGSESPAKALDAVLRILRDDGVARASTPSADALLNWHHALVPELSQPEDVADPLVSNWYPVVSLPETINFFEIARPLANATKEPASIASGHPLPMTAHLRRLVSFADAEAAQKPLSDETPLRLDHSMKLDQFLSGGDDKIQFERGEPRKHLASLLRQAWESLAAGSGLLPFKLSEHNSAWYVPEGVLEGGKVAFSRVSGTSGWRRLHGKYGLRDRTWHFGVAARAMLRSPPRLRLTPHVIYTDPQGAKPASAAYRRAHCKLWFNAKWRDLLYAYVKFLANDKGKLLLPLSSNQSAVIDSTPFSVWLPVRPDGAVEASVATSTDDDGDVPDLDLSQLVNDPAFSGHIDFDDELHDAHQDLEEHTANSGRIG